MSSTEEGLSTSLAGTLFDEVIVARAKAARASGARYFPLKGDPAASSYFDAPDVKFMSASDFELPGGGEPDGLIDALVELWKSQGETELAGSMAERLKPIAAALREETANDDGSVDILCYTLF